MLCVDKLPAAGYRSTSGSCSIIRPYYSAVDGPAVDWKSHFYWRDWLSVLGVNDECGLAYYVNCDCLRLKSPVNDFLEPTIKLID